MRLYNDRLGAIHVALPPRDEQIMIIHGLASQLSGPLAAIERINREIDLLREYRARLVADLVTGKLDVREAAARIPEDASLGTAAGLTDESDGAELADEEAEA